MPRITSGPGCEKVTSVTIVIRRSVGMLVGLSAAAVLLSACGSGPSQVGSALIVGSTSVSVDQVQQELDNVLSQPAVQTAQKQGKLDEVSRSIVTRHALHQLVLRAEGQYHITATDQQVDALITQIGGQSKAATELSVDPAQVRDSVKDVLVEAALARKYADTLAVNFGYITASTRADAVTYADKIAANPGSLDTIVNTANAAAQASGSQTGAGETAAQLTVTQFLASVQQGQQQAAQSGQSAPVENDGPVFGSPANTVVVFQPDAQTNPIWVVALIKSRTTATATAPAGASAADSSDIGTLSTLGQSLLQSEAASAGITVSPRYGVWDLADMRVIAANDQTAGLELPVHRVQS
jgi:hypothetical protein